MTLMEQNSEINSNGSLPQDNAVPAGIFRAYDIRGIVDKELTEQNVMRISQGIGSEALENGIDTLLVGYDGRLSSPLLSQVLVDGILSTGCNVINLGLVPTPLLYFATHTTGHTSGVMLTASHNPSNYNGLKIVFDKTCLAANQIQQIRHRIEENRFLEGTGTYKDQDISAPYSATVCSKIDVQRNMKLVIDCGNAVPGIIAPQLFTKLGCDVESIFCEVDGSFPNHHPDPTVSANLELLASKVVEVDADLGIAFDGDGDRLGIITDNGKFIDADQIMMLLISEIAPNYSGEPIIFDVKCSSKLPKLISDLGCRPVMHRSGHSFMKQKMEETSAPLGGEFAAHIFLRDDWYGFDDGLYVAARLVEILSRQQESATAVFQKFETGVTTPELKIEIDDDVKFEVMERILKLADFPDAEMIRLDGLRVEFDDGWGLIRASNTSPALLLRFEADSAQRLSDIQSEFKALIQRADKSLEFSF